MANLSDELREQARQMVKEAKARKEDFLSRCPGDRESNERAYNKIDFNKLNNRAADDPEFEETVLKVYRLIYGLPSDWTPEQEFEKGEQK